MQIIVLSCHIHIDVTMRVCIYKWYMIMRLKAWAYGPNLVGGGGGGGGGAGGHSIVEH